VHISIILFAEVEALWSTPLLLAKTYVDLISPQSFLFKEFNRVSFLPWANNASKKCTTKMRTKKAVTGFPQVFWQKIAQQKSPQKGSDRFPMGTNWLQKNCTTEKPTKKAVTGFPWVQTDSKKIVQQKSPQKWQWQVSHRFFGKYK
jgi:hypothetical protein